MFRIAHLSDLHLIEEGVRSRRGVSRIQLEYLSLLKKIDPVARRERAQRALAAAVAANADHVVITGDLTEDGSPDQFDILRQLLDESGLRPEQLTVLSGNHDAHGMAWSEALAGPLDRWTAHATPGAVIPLGDARMVHVHTSVIQPFWMSGGTAPSDQLEEVVKQASRSDRLVILAQHHPPFRLYNNWVHGLTNVAAVRELMLAHENVSLVYGHMHIERDVELVAGEGPRAFAPCGVVTGDRPVRVYTIEGKRLVPTTPAAVGRAARRGTGMPDEARTQQEPSPPPPAEPG